VPFEPAGGSRTHATNLPARRRAIICRAPLRLGGPELALWSRGEPSTPGSRRERKAGVECAMRSGRRRWMKGRPRHLLLQHGPLNKPTFTNTRTVAPSRAAWPLRLARMPTTVARTATPRSMTKISHAALYRPIFAAPAGHPSHRVVGWPRDAWARTNRSVSATSTRWPSRSLPDRGVLTSSTIAPSFDVDQVASGGSGTQDLGGVLSRET